MKKYTVKELSSIAGITSMTLRRYEALGVIHPERDEENDYRLYEWRDFVQLLRIRSLRNYGLNMKEISTAYGSDITGARQVYADHLTDIDSQIALLQRQRELTELQQGYIDLWQELWQAGYKRVTRPECLVFPYRTRSGDDLIDPKEKATLAALMEHMPPLRSCTLFADDEDHGYGGLYAFAHQLTDLPDHCRKRALALPECECIAVAVKNTPGMGYHNSVSPDYYYTETTLSHVLKAIEVLPFTVKGTVLSEVLHMNKLPDDDSTPPMENFRSYSISWIPIG